MDQATKLLLAVGTEGVVLVVVSFVVLMLYIRYAQRRKPAALSLAVAFTFYNIAIICLFIFRILTYLQEIGRLGLTYDYSGIGINLGYAFSALSNVFIMIFVAIVFAQSPIFRRTGMLIPLIVGALNGITIGLLIGATINGWPTPSYDLGPTIYHLFLTIISFSSLIVFTVQPHKSAILQWEKAGFQFIITSGVFGILVYLFFAMDVFLGDIVLIWSSGYTPFFFFAYICAIIMCLFAYLGYVMPNFIRNWFKGR